jgi:hypothetical protein
LVLLLAGQRPGSLETQFLVAVCVFQISEMWE